MITAETQDELKLPPANGMCSACIKSNQTGGPNQRTIVIYCEHNQAAAIMRSREGRLMGQWLIITPISAGELTDRMTNGNLP
jgi:hypothetical protein